MKCTTEIGVCYRCGAKARPLTTVHGRKVCPRCARTMRRLDAEKRQLPLFSAPSWRPR